MIQSGPRRVEASSSGAQLRSRAMSTAINARPVRPGTSRQDGVEIAPAFYYVPADLESVVDLLAAHGVAAEPLEADATVSAE